jgi:glycosidase
MQTILKYFNMNKKIIFLLTLISLSSVQFVAAQKMLTQPEWSKNAVMYEVNLRQYSDAGTINAFSESLPRLKEMGVDVLWMMPLHPIGALNRKGGLGSYYSVKDYKGLAPEYGTKEDFKKMVKSAHAKGMKVIIDWVANHSSWDNAWIQEHPSWYVKDTAGKIVTQYDWSDVAKLDYNNKEMRAAMIESMRYWVTEFDIDGFRCDVAFLVPLDFWMEARLSLEQIKPMYMLAEMEWNADITPRPNDYFNYAFNAAYGWNFMGVTADYAAGKKTLDQLKTELTQNYAKFPAHMQKLYFLTNHDENSWNGTVDEKYGKNWQQFGVMVYTMPNNMPLIYTGEEVGLNRRMAFFEKDNIKETEWANTSRVAWYKSMTKLRHTVPAFYANGPEISPKYLDAKVDVEASKKDVLCYHRKNGKSEAYVFINFSNNQIMLGLEGVNFYKDFKSFKKESNGNDMIHGNEMMLSPNSYVVYYK